MKKLTLLFLVLINIYTVVIAQQAVFQKMYGTSTYADEPMNIITTTDSNYVTGYRENFALPNHLHISNLIKLDNSSNVIWSKKFSSPLNIVSIKKIRQTLNGGYIMGGEYNTLTDTATSVILIKTDANGDTLWTKGYINQQSLVVNDIQQSHDGGIVVTCIYYTRPPLTTNHIEVFKTDSAGKLLWSKIMQGPIGEAIFNICINTDNSIMLMGYYGDTTLINGAGLLIKADANGDTLWSKIYYTPNTDIFGYDLNATNDSMYVFTGRMNGALQPNSFITKLDNTGNLIWANMFSTTNIYSFGRFIMQAHDGGFLLSCTSKYPNNRSYGLNIKTDALGNFEWSRKYGNGLASFEYATNTTDSGFILTGSQYPSSGYINAYLVKTNSIGQAGCLDSVVTYNTTPFTPQIKSPKLEILNDTSLTYRNIDLIVSSGIIDTTICISYLSINELASFKSTLFISPNPNNGTFNVNYNLSLNKSNLFQIFDAMGKCVYNTTLLASSYTKQINLNSIAKGLYVCKVGNDVVRFVKE